MTPQELGDMPAAKQTIRQRFAAQFMEALLANPNLTNTTTESDPLAICAIGHADALLARLAAAEGEAR